MLVNRLAVALAAAGRDVHANAALAEDGYDLWLRYAPLEGQAKAALERFDPQLEPSAPEADPIVAAAVQELDRGLSSLLGRSVATRWRSDRAADCDSDVAGPEAVSAYTAAKRTRIRDRGIGTTSAASTAAFALLRELSLGTRSGSIALDQRPAMPLRMLNHWDNPDGSVERGYAGRSIFDWWHLPERLDPRMIDYARANASIGINGSVVNNVNASALFLTPRYLPKLARAGRCLAAVWHPALHLRPFQCATRHRRAGHRRSARSAGARMVAGQGGRDLCRHSRFRRLSGQGQFRRPAGPAGLWPHPCRRREHAGRGRGRSRHGDLARLRLFGRGRDRPRQAGI